MQGVWDALSEQDALKVKSIVDSMVDGTLVIDNAAGAFKPLRVEEYMTIDEFAGWKNLRVIIFGHYGKQNGDTMSDPEVMFLYKDDESVIYPLVVPYYFKNDYMGVEDETIDISTKKINTRKQKEVKSFFLTFLKNIYEQQGLKAAAPSEKLKEVRAERVSGKKLVNRVVVMSGALKKYPLLRQYFDQIKSSDEESLLAALDRGEAAFIKELVVKYAGFLPIIHRVDSPEIYFSKSAMFKDIEKGDLPLEEAIILVKKVAPERIDIIGALEKYTAKPPMDTNKTIEEQEKTTEVSEAAAAEQTPSNWFVGDNYFKENPQNVLGVAYESSGRFGKVTKYKGTIEDVSRIEAETNFLKPYNFDTNPLVSETRETPQEKILKPVVQDNVKRAIEQSKSDVNKKLVKAKHNIHISAQHNAELQSTHDIYNKYNPEIADEELFAFIWYRDSIGQRLSSHWYEVAHSKGGDTDYIYSEETLTKWVNEGILFYYSGSQVRKGSTNLIPSYLYLSENIWHKQAWIEQDKDAIVEKYGEAVYTQQKEKLGQVFKVKYDNRLTLKGSGVDDGLMLLPISDFAAKFKVKTLADEEPFVLKAVSTSGKRFGRPDFFHPDFLDKAQWGRSKATEFEEITLVDAFCTWLVKDKTINFKRGTNFFEIIDVYIFAKRKPAYESTKDDRLGRQREDAQFERIKARAKEEGDKLFLDFLNTQLTLNDRIRLETEWNGTFNSYVPINFQKVPVLFECNKWWDGAPLEILPEKREAAAFIFSEGAGCLAYGTGIGKTFSSIFTIAQFMYAGYSKKPVFIVPNSVYKQFMNEIKGLLPQFKIIGLYNLSKKYLDQLRDDNGNVIAVPDNSITIMTYEGFENIGFNEETANMLMGELYAILNQGGVEENIKRSEKQIAGFQAKLEKLVGRGLRGTMINIEDLGFDYMNFDEAHKNKKVFTTVKGNEKKDEEGEKEGGRERNRYQIQSGTPSAIALKAFMLAYYIQQKNDWRNICLLTATPFTNSPLEIFSMLSFIAYRKLKEMDMNSLQNFFDTYIDVTTELVINAKLQPERKQVIKGFNNLVALQQLIRRFINYKGEEDVETKKPNKIVLPLKYKRVGDTVIQLSPDEQVETNLPLTYEQQVVMDQIKEYVEGKIDFDQFDLSVFDEDIELDDESEETNEGNRTAGIVMNYEDLDEEEKTGVRILRGMNLARNLALSPYLLAGGSGSKCKIPQSLTYKKYIETSPKLQYTMECVRSVKEWHEANDTPISGQIIYMDRGICYFGLIREYLIKELGYKPHEVELVYSGLPKDGYKSKSAIQDRFLGVRFNEETMEMEYLPEEERVKVLIGSSTIREGMNLQRYSSVLYNDFVDWNPTDSIQLDGRIHRQKNLFNNVRIVIPLMIDSMDIFIFQKLEEKTSRINTIWATDGKQNVLKLEDFNPREMKNALIKDANVLAKMQIEENIERLEDEEGSLNSEIKRVENIQKYLKDVSNNIEEATELLEKYRDVKAFDSGTPIWEKAKYLIGRIQDLYKKKTDKEGLRLLTDVEKEYPTPEIKKLIQEGKVSEQEWGEYDWDQPAWVKTLNYAQRQLQKESEGYLIPNKIKVERLDNYVEKVKNRIVKIKEQIKDAGSDERIKYIANEIIAERKRNKYRVKSVMEVVADFKKLNYLLGDKKNIEPPKPRAISMPAVQPLEDVRLKIRSLIDLIKAQ